MLRVGIIGTGFGMYGLLPAFGSLKNCQVVSICGKGGARLDRFCKKYKVKKVYANWQEMLEKEDLDALAIAVIPEIQYEIAKTALKKGLQVFAEKPLAANLRQAQELYRLSQKFQATTAVDFIFPQVPEFKKAKELLLKKEIGKLEYVKAEWDFLSFDLAHNFKSWKTDAKKGGGALAYYFSHMLYYLEFFLGELGSLKAEFSYSKRSLNGAETGVDLLFKNKAQVTGSAHLNCSASGVNSHSVMFVGDKGTIFLENHKDVTAGFKIRIYKNGKESEIKLKKLSSFGEDQRVAILKENVKNFVWGCEKNKTITPSFKEGLRVQALINQIRKQSI
jgi:predicted dehydrogenase